MLLIMENKILIIYILENFRSMQDCNSHFLQTGFVVFSALNHLDWLGHWVTAKGWPVWGWWMASLAQVACILGVWRKKSHTHLFVFNTNERFRQMDLLLACFSFLFFAFSLSLVRYILFPLKCSKVNIYALRVWIPLCLSQKDISMSLNSTNVRTVN